MFVGILLHDLARDFDVEFESSSHREIFEVTRARTKKKLQGATLTIHEKKFTITKTISDCKNLK